MKAPRLKHPVEYQAWYNMKWRCLNVRAKDYANYGGRGITPHPDWITFGNFYRDMGPCPAGLTLDRIDNEKGYEPGNCRWATKQEQDNNKRTNRWLTHNGQTKTFKQWAREYQISEGCLRHRLATGRSLSESLSPRRLAIGRPASTAFATIDGDSINLTQIAKHLAMPRLTLWRYLRRANVIP